MSAIPAGAVVSLRLLVEKAQNGPIMDSGADKTMLKNKTVPAVELAYPATQAAIAPTHALQARCLRRSCLRSECMATRTMAMAAVKYGKVESNPILKLLAMETA